MFVDFGMAQQYDGVCYLRFDDTNPEAEKQVGRRARVLLPPPLRARRLPGRQAGSGRRRQRACGGRRRSVRRADAARGWHAPSPPCVSVCCSCAGVHRPHPGDCQLAGMEALEGGWKPGQVTQLRRWLHGRVMVGRQALLQAHVPPSQSLLCRCTLCLLLRRSPTRQTTLTSCTTLRCS